jgi:DNA-binding response OmpR family regulator
MKQDLMYPGYPMAEFILNWAATSSSPMIETFEPKKILLLDDDPTYCKLVERFGAQRSIPVTACGDATEFLKTFQDIKPDVAIIDFHLDEGLNGLEIARRIGSTPVLLISRKASWLLEKGSWGSNIKSFVHKKYGVPKLLDTALDLARYSQH